MKDILRDRCRGMGYYRLWWSHVHRTCSSKPCANTMIGLTKPFGYEASFGLKLVSGWKCNGTIGSAYVSRKRKQVRIQDDRSSRLLLHGVAVDMWERSERVKGGVGKVYDTRPYRPLRARLWKRANMMHTCHMHGRDEPVTLISPSSDDRWLAQ